MKKIIAWILVVAVLCTVGIVSIFAVNYGDINCDGDIRTTDAVLLAQYLALWKVDISAEGMEAADVLHDGVVNSKDAVLLAQYLALWKVTLGPGSSNPGGDSGNTPDDNPGIGDNEVPFDDLENIY